MPDLKRYIYFPPGHVPNRAPKVVWIEGMSIGGSLKGSEREEEVREGRFQFYPYKRCQIYSERLWEDCQQWVAERDQVESKFDCLMRKGVLNVSTPESVSVSDL